MRRTSLFLLPAVEMQLFSWPYSFLHFSSKGLVQARLMHFTLSAHRHISSQLGFQGETLSSIAEEKLLPNLLKCRSVIHGRKDSFPSVAAKQAPLCPSSMPPSEV